MPDWEGLEMIPQRMLSLLSNRLAKGEKRRIPESVFERDYCLSWFLACLAENKLNNTVVFKGGTAIKKCYIRDYRFSEDLDFTLVKETLFDDILKNLDEIFKKVEQDSGIKMQYILPDEHARGNTYSFFLGYEGPLPGNPDKKVKIDITKKEKIVFPGVIHAVMKEYPEYEDLPENRMINVYALEEIAAEKVVALMDKARNEPLDLYDIWYLTANNLINITELLNAVEQKLEFRNRKLDLVKADFKNKEARLRKLWEIRLESQMVSLPEFEEVFRNVQREFRKAGIL